MKRLGRGLLGALVGFVLSTLISYVLVAQYSPRQDRELEAAMTSVFFFGPVGAGLAFLVGLLW
jgi:ABC-type antimicrobial peptide transport system permease subunit